MYNILAINKTTKNTLICENFVEDKVKSLKEWTESGMKSCIYKAVKIHNWQSSKIQKLKRDGHLRKTNNEPFVKHI